MTQILKVTYAVITTLHPERDRTKGHIFDNTDEPRLMTMFDAGEYPAAIDLLMEQMAKLHTQTSPYIKEVEFSAGIVLKRDTIAEVIKFTPTHD